MLAFTGVTDDFTILMGSHKFFYDQGFALEINNWKRFSATSSIGLSRLRLGNLHSFGWENKFSLLIPFDYQETGSWKSAFARKSEQAPSSLAHLIMIRILKKAIFIMRIILILDWFFK
jgi:hypothetical protein